MGEDFQRRTMDVIGAPAAIALYATAWLALASWAVSTWLRFPRSRLLWTVGCLANLGHVLLAMHIVHAWDHDLAYTAVARQTYQETGLDSGVGLYINYALAALWLVDTLAWWLVPHRYERRSRWLDGPSACWAR
jgi:hypothetical protein